MPKEAGFYLNLGKIRTPPHCYHFLPLHLIINNLVTYTANFEFIIIMMINLLTLSFKNVIKGNYPTIIIKHNNLTKNFKLPFTATTTIDPVNAIN